MTMPKASLQNIPQLKDNAITLSAPPPVTHIVNGSKEDCSRILVRNPGREATFYRMFLVTTIGNNQYVLAPTVHGFTEK